MKKPQFNWSHSLLLSLTVWRFLSRRGNFFASWRPFFINKLPFFQQLLHSTKLVFAGLSLLLFLFGGSLCAETVGPAGFGPMSSTQPDRETAVLSGNLLRTGGQNPTLKIVWGDEDGEISGQSWDNTAVISTHQAVGSFSTTSPFPIRITKNNKWKPILLGLW